MGARVLDSVFSMTVFSIVSWCPDCGRRTRHNGDVKIAVSRKRAEPRRSTLRHVLVAGGSVDEWAAFSEEQWRARLADLVNIARSSGARHVTVHPHEPSGLDGRAVVESSVLETMRRVVVEDGIRVVVDPVVDGRERIVGAVSSWPRSRKVTEKRLSAALFGEAGEPDLVVVLGPDDRLPSSLVWELAYGELVFVAVHWFELGSGHLEAAVDDYAGRQRRFGGVE